MRIKEIFEKYFPIAGLILMIGLACYLSYSIIKILGTIGLVIVTLFIVVMYLNLYLFSLVMDYLHDYISNQNKINFNNVELFSILLYLIGPIFGFSKKEKKEEER